MPKALRIRRDAIIEEMAKGLGARVVELEAPFNPEGGAYVKAENGAMGRHDHDHHHDPGHAHARGHEHDREHPRKDHHQGEQDHAASGARDVIAPTNTNMATTVAETGRGMILLALMIIFARGLAIVFMAAGVGMAVIVMVIVARRLPVLGLHVSAALGIERRLERDDPRPKPLGHRLDDRISADAQRLR